MPSLFDYTLEFQALQDITQEEEFDQETGEYIDNSETIQQLFNDLKLDLDTKLNNTRYLMLELESGAKTLKDEAKRLNERAKVMENKSAMLKQLIFGAVQILPDKKIKTDKFNFTIAKSQPSVKILDEESLPRAYRVAKWSADKKKIKEALQNGEDIQGCSLEVSESLRIK